MSETGRIRFPGVRRFQTPNSVSFIGLAEFRGANSVSSFQPIICVSKRTHRVFRRTHRVCPETQWGSASFLLRNSTLETVFRPFPKMCGKCQKVWKSAKFALWFLPFSFLWIRGVEVHPLINLVAPSTGWMQNYLCFTPSTAIGPPLQ